MRWLAPPRRTLASLLPAASFRRLAPCLVLVSCACAPAGGDSDRARSAEPAGGGPADAAQDAGADGAVVVVDLLAALVLEVRGSDLPAEARDRILSDVALAYVQQNDVAKAEAVAAGLTGELAKSVALAVEDGKVFPYTYAGRLAKTPVSEEANRVRILLSGGKVGEALRVAGGIIPDRERNEALAGVAVACALSGEDGKAVEALRDVNGLLPRWRALGEVVRAYGKAGRLDQARKVIYDIGIQGECEPMLAQAAVEAAEAGHVDEALDLGRGLRDGACRAAVLAAAGTSLAKAGDLERARKVLLEARGPALACAAVDEACEPILWEISGGFLLLGDAGHALGIAREIEDPGIAGEAIADVARWQIEAGRIDEAGKTAKLVKAAGTRMDLLGAISIERAKKGEVGEAARLARQVARLSGSGDCWEMVEAMCPVVEALVASGKADEAEDLGGSVKNTYCLRGFLVCLGVAHAKAGNHQEAIDLFDCEGRGKETPFDDRLESVPPGESRDLVLAEKQYQRKAFLEKLIGFYASKGDLDHGQKAMEIMIENGGLWHSVGQRAAIHLAKALVADGRIDDAVALADRFKDAYFRSGILMHVSDACLVKGNLERAGAIMEDASKTRSDSLVLMDLADAHLKAGSFEKALFVIHFIDATHYGFGNDLCKEKEIGRFLDAYTGHIRKKGHPPAAKDPEILKLVLP